MTLWGPAIDAEIEYRQAEARKAWGSRRTSGAGRAARRRERTAQEGTAQERTARERSARTDRSEEIRKGIEGMRPARPARRGLFA